MFHIWLIIKITFKEGMRSRVLFGITLLAMLLFALNLVIVKLFSIEVGKVMIDIAFSALSLSGLSVIFFLGISLLSQDIHNKTAYMIISRPVTRTQYIFGKFGGLALLLLAVMGILGCLALISFFVCFQLNPHAAMLRNFSWVMVIGATFFTYLSLLVVLSFAFLFTLISSSMYLAMLFTFCVYIIGHTLETIVKVLVKGEFLRADPLLVQVMKGVKWLFPNLAAFDLKTSLAYGLPQQASHLIWTGLYGIGYAALMILFTLWAFQRKDVC